MTKLFDAFRQRDTMRRVVALARQIADRSQGDVWNRVRQLIFDMDLVEARGYVRVRAAAVIRQQMIVTIHGRHNLPASALPTLSSVATERVVQLVISDFVTRGPVARRAAA